MPGTVRAVTRHPPFYEGAVPETQNVHSDGVKSKYAGAPGDMPLARIEALCINLL